MIQLDNDTQLQFTIFKDQYTVKPLNQVKLDYSQFLDILSEPKIGRKNSNNSFVGGIVAPERKNANVKNRCMLTLDYDDIPHDIEHLFDHISSNFDYSFAMYSTHNHTEFHHKFRLVIPLSEPIEISANKYKRLIEYVSEELLKAPFFDPASAVLSQVMHLPTCTDENNYFFDYVDEKLFDVNHILNNLPDDEDIKVTPTEEWLKLLKGINEGGRNIAASKLAGHLLNKDVHPNIVYEFLTMWNERNVPKLSENELDRTFNSILKKEIEVRKLYSFDGLEG